MVNIMPKSMHLVRGMTSLNTKKRKTKITKKRMLELKEEHRLHNKKYKKDKMLNFMVMDFDTFVKWRFGKLKYKPKNTGNYEPVKTNVETKTKIPSKVDSHDKNACAKKEPKVYDGERKLIGIGMLHKSNLVPIFDKEHAVDIAKMRR